MKYKNSGRARLRSTLNPKRPPSPVPKVPSWANSSFAPLPPPVCKIAYMPSVKTQTTGYENGIRNQQKQLTCNSSSLSAEHSIYQLYKENRMPQAYGIYIQATDSCTVWMSQCRAAERPKPARAINQSAWLLTIYSSCMALPGCGSWGPRVTTDHLFYRSSAYWTACLNRSRRCPVCITYTTVCYPASIRPRHNG